MRLSGLISLSTALLASLALAACGGGGGGDGEGESPARAEPPSIVFTFPTEGEANVDEHLECVLHFATPLDPTSIGALGAERFELRDPCGRRVPATVLYGDAGGVPKLKLEPVGGVVGLGGRYTMRLLPGIRDIEGNERQTTFELSFTVRDGAFATYEPFEATNDRASGRRIEINRAGDGLALWIRLDAASNESLYARRVSNGNEVGPSMLVRVGRNLGSVEPDVADNGDAIIVWTESSNGKRDLRFRRYQASTGFWSLVRTIEGVADVDVRHVDSDMGAGGRAAIAWVEGVAAPFDLHAVVVDDNADVPVPTPLESEPGDVGDVHVAVQANGIVTVACSIERGANDVDTVTFTDTGTGFGSARDQEAVAGATRPIALSALGTQSTFLAWVEGNGAGILRARRLVGAVTEPSKTLDPVPGYHTLRFAQLDGSRIVAVWNRSAGGVGQVFRSVWAPALFGPSIPLSDPNPALGALDPKGFGLDTDLCGTEVAYWPEAREGDVYMAVRLSGPEGSFTRYVGPTREPNEPTMIARMLADRSAMTVWEQRGATAGEHTTVFATRLRADGLLENPIPLNPQGEQYVAEVLFDVDALGRGLAIYREYEIGGDHEVHANALR